jgi:multidrug resistance efflux pump
MAVKAKWERPDGRRQLSVSAPMFVDYNDGRLRANDWSLSGFTFAQCAKPRPVGQVDDVKVTLPFQGFDVSFRAPVRVVESDAKQGTYSVEYVSLGDRERELLCHFLDELVRGNMVDVRDTIQRLDGPVTPVSMEPTAQVAAEAAATPSAWGLRSVSPSLMSALYASLGLLVFGYFGYLVYGNVFRFEVENAVVSSPTETILAQGEGYIEWGNFRAGEPVKAGDVLANLFDNQLERDIEVAEIAVREKEARFALLQRRAEDGPIQLQSAVDGQPHGVTKLKLDVESLRARVQATEQELRRVSIKPRDVQRPARIEEAKKKLLAYQKALESKELELKARAERDAIPTDRVTTANEPVQREMTSYEVQAVQASQDYEFAQQRYLSAVAHRGRLAIKAPFDGRLVALPHANKAAVRKGDNLAIVEQSAAPTVTAFLSALDAMRIGLGDRAKFYVPALGDFHSARVTQIDRVANAGREADRGHVEGAARPSQADQWKVVLSLEHPELVGAQKDYISGLPVVVQFQRRWTNTLSTTLRRRATDSAAVASGAVNAVPARASTVP